MLPYLTFRKRSPESLDFIGFFRSVEFSGLVVPENWRELLLRLQINFIFLFITNSRKVFCGAFFQKSDLSRFSFSPINQNLKMKQIQGDGCPPLLIFS